MNITIFEPASPSDLISLKEGATLFKHEYKGKETVSFSFFGEMGKKNELLPYISSCDGKKARLFETLVDRRDQRVIMFSRGGYGTLRWLGMVDFERISKGLEGRLFVGFSDLTFLASKLVGLGHTFLHGPMLSTLKDTDPESRRALYKFLSEGGLPMVSGKGVSPGNCTGKLIGGNLTCLCHTIGTPFEPDWEKSICFLEDCGEEIYRIDRMLTHLIECGALGKVKGIATGTFVLKKDEPSKQETLDALLKDRLSGLKKPVVTGLPCGHGPKNMPLLLGACYSLDGEKGILSPLESKATA